MARLLPGVPEDEYRLLWNHSISLISLESENTRLEALLRAQRRDFVLYALHQQFRSPWAIEKPDKEVALEKIFALSRPENAETYQIRDGTRTFDLIQEVYDKRVKFIYEMVTDERITANDRVFKLYSCSMNIACFSASYMIPAIFGYFFGRSNLEAFVEAVGIVFDAFAHDPVPFLMTFEDRFMCYVLRQFFFSSVVTIAEEFTVYVDFFARLKKTDFAHYPRIQRFFGTFINQFIAVIDSSPILRILFSRISREFSDKSQLIMAVIVYTIFLPTVSHPTAFAVIPLSSNYEREEKKSVDVMRYYCAVSCNIPITSLLSARHPQVRESELIDEAAVMKLVDELLNVGSTTLPNTPEIESVQMPVGVLEALAEFYGEHLDGEVIEQCCRPENIVTCRVLSRCQEPEKQKVDTADFRMAIELISSRHLNTFSELTPRLKAMSLYFEHNPIDFTALDAAILEAEEAMVHSNIDLQSAIEYYSLVIQKSKGGLAAVDACFANRIATKIHDKGLGAEVVKRRAGILNDGQLMPRLICGVMDGYVQENPWAKPFLPMAARRLHSLLMRNFPIHDFRESQMPFIDQRFLSFKREVLDNLEKDGFDDCVRKMTASDEILSTAQMAVMRACLFENPVESAHQIVASLFIVEDLFAFEFGKQPEANQLMPLLAYLFVRSPVPTPLSMGCWLNHFLRPISSMRPEWFLEEKLRPLEHYIQFTNWMEEMLQSLSRGKS